MQLERSCRLAELLAIVQWRMLRRSVERMLPLALLTTALSTSVVSAQETGPSASQPTRADCLQAWESMWEVSSQVWGTTDLQRLDELKAEIETYRPLLDKCKKRGWDGDTCYEILSNEASAQDTLDLWQAAEARAAEGEKTAESLRPLIESMRGFRDRIEACQTGGGSETLDPPTRQGGIPTAAWLGGGALLVGGGVALAATGGGEDPHTPAGAAPTTTTTTMPPALPSVVSLSGVKRDDSCDEGFYPDQLANPAVNVSYDGTNLTVHSTADVAGPFNSATGEWTGRGTFEGHFGAGTETYSGTWTFQNGRWVFRGTLTFQFADCVVTYDVELVGVG